MNVKIWIARNLSCSLFIGDVPWAVIFGFICWNPALTPHLSKVELVISWLPPPTGWVNNDASVRGSSTLAFGGGVLRDSQGRWIAWFATNWGSFSILAGELLSIKKGLVLARFRDFKEIVIESDSSSAVRHILCDEEPPGYLRSLVM
ncbi:uncharacterized protein LOC110634114 [Hevea brasiliensis]|uniref:uncharacterized protein LOC110634114 n=1 Tax=Hevea brasiliensis TaxID=3981 RepID=UPI000B788641|nr:uncharacterized protein LOC110634114 [Hevea brasiliensis]